MSLDIKTTGSKPRRQTYAHIARRFGEDKPASRYEEAVLDVQATAHFHYRPTWQPEFELYDVKRTQIAMADWYALRDPRQLYYGTYNMSRGTMMAAADRNFTFVEERNLLATMEPAWALKVRGYLLPLRHYEWGANMNSFFVTDFGYGTALTSASAFAGFDRLGMAQILSRVGLALDAGTGTSLEDAKKAWVNEKHWQGLRRVVEDTFVIQDPIETFVAQNLAMDSVIHPLFFRRFDAAGQGKGATGVSLLTEFMPEWFKDHSRWVDAVSSRMASESPENAKTLGGWYRTWSSRTVEAALPLAEYVLGADGKAAVEGVVTEANLRAQKLGLGV